MIIPSKHLELKQNKAFSSQTFSPIACSYPRWQDNRSEFARAEEILQDQVKKSKEKKMENSQSLSSLVSASLRNEDDEVLVN